MIPYLDLKRQYESIAEDIEEAVLSTLRSRQYVLGEPVECFEENFAAYCGTKHAIAVNSGTSALHLALLASGVGPGDEVITVPSTFVATVAAILYCGATPVFVDVDPDTLTMDPLQCARAVTQRTKAIVPVHFHGRLADMKKIDEIAYANRLMLIEDAAQAHGARRDGKRAGAFGDLGCFSFYPGKNLGAAGEGGAVTTSDPDLAARIRALRDWGQIDRSVHALQGFNFRMDAVQGAVLNVKLRHIDGWNAMRARSAAAYDTVLSDRVERPEPATDGDYVYHVYAIAHDRRDALRATLTEAGIGTNIHYPRPVHLQPAYAHLANGNGSFPVSERNAARTLSLPMFAELTKREIDFVANAVNAFVQDPTVQQRVKVVA
ncbi:MAG: DegT/DnrJ/EryC1/StrS family aminotransferase [Litorimonas sp.]